MKIRNAIQMEAVTGLRVAGRTAEEEAGVSGFWRGWWRVADPKISLASFASVFLGGCLAWAQSSRWSWGWLMLTVAAVWALEIAKNASGEIYDEASGVDRLVGEADRTPFSGGKRVLVDQLWTRRETIWYAGCAYAAAIGLGLMISWHRHPGVFWLGVAGTGLAFGYHASPVKLAYRGWGELAVALCYGPLIGAGTYLVQRQRWSWDPVWWGVPLGVMIGAFLWVNEMPDRWADEEAGKRTLVVAVGFRAASWMYLGWIALAGGWMALLPLAGFSKAMWWGEVFLIPAVPAAWKLIRSEGDAPSLIPIQKYALASFVFMAVGLGTGILISR